MNDGHDAASPCAAPPRTGVTEVRWRGDAAPTRRGIPLSRRDHERLERRLLRPVADDRTEPGSAVRPGRGYLLGNTCWLHARTTFTGPRVCSRVLGEQKGGR